MKKLDKKKVLKPKKLLKQKKSKQVTINLNDFTLNNIVVTVSARTIYVKLKR